MEGSGKEKMKLGSHVGMSGKEMMLASVKEALSYKADTFMLYTGAPQNTKRKELGLLRIPEAHALMKEHGIRDFVVHAPYIINLANSVQRETFSFSVETLASEMERCEAMGGSLMVLHPGAHVGAGVKAGIDKLCEGLNQVLHKNSKVYIALETMAGKGSELGGSFEELEMIYEKVNYPEKLRICFDTCHTHDAGYAVKEDFGAVMEQFQSCIGKDQIAVFHINDSKNGKGARKDRHANLGQGEIGFEALHRIVWWPGFENVPKILETPYIPFAGQPKKSAAPYRAEIEMLRTGRFFCIEPEKEAEILAENRKMGGGLK